MERLIQLCSIGDDHGYMTVIENNQEIPFTIKRIFYIYGACSSIVRGKHANRNSQFVLISVKGSCKVKVINRLGEETDYLLDSPTKGLYIPNMLWKDMYEFSNDNVLLCLASEKYDPSEYIKDIDEYFATK